MKNIIDSEIFVAVISFVLGAVCWEIIKDRLLFFIHKNHSNNKFIASGVPQIFIETLRTKDDILQTSKRLTKCSKLFNAEFFSTGNEGSCSVQLIPKVIQFSDVSISSGNIVMVHIENTTDYSASVKGIMDSQKHVVSCICAELSYIEKGDTLALLFNEYTTLSTITLDYNGQRLEYKFTDKTGSVKPTVKR